MKKEDRTALVTLPIIILIGLGVASAGSQGGLSIFSIPLFSLAVVTAFVIQWAVFVVAYIRQSEKAFDITGSITYVTVSTSAVLLVPQAGDVSVLLLALILIWATRLGTFLFLRIQKAGKDERFDEIKRSFIRFLNTWTLQGLWVTLTAAAELAAITATKQRDFDIFALLGFLVWVFGFVFEVMADIQKSRFRANPVNRGSFISTGLWGRSRHPNYFGEILLWIGVAIIAAPSLRGWQWITMISPVFVALLLSRVSGVPILEKRADTKWGGRDEYEEYKRNTPVLIPRLW